MNLNFYFSSRHIRQKMFLVPLSKYIDFLKKLIEPVHEISNNVVCVTSKAQISLRMRAV